MVLADNGSLPSFREHPKIVRLGTCTVTGNLQGLQDELMTDRRMILVMTVLLVLTYVACERQGPAPKPIGSATNKHVEETPAGPARGGADAMIQHMKTPMDEARQTEDLLKGAADRTRQQADQTTP
jgi:hypothetical protein